MFMVSWHYHSYDCSKVAPCWKLYETKKEAVKRAKQLSKTSNCTDILVSKVCKDFVKN